MGVALEGEFTYFFCFMLMELVQRFEQYFDYEFATYYVKLLVNFLV